MDCWTHLLLFLHKLHPYDKMENSSCPNAHGCLHSTYEFPQLKATMFFTISPNLWMLFEKAFPLVFILNRTGQEPTVLWHYYCSNWRALNSVNTTAIASRPCKPGWVCGWSHRRVCFPLYPSQQAKRKYCPVAKGKKGCFGLVLSCFSRWQDNKWGQLHFEQVLLLFMWSREFQRFLSPSPLPQNRRIIWNTSS